MSQQLRNKYSHIPWSDIAGMRDKLIHDYFGIDIDAVWTTVQKDVPALKAEAQKIIKALK